MPRRLLWLKYEFYTKITEKKWNPATVLQTANKHFRDTGSPALTKTNVFERRSTWDVSVTASPMRPGSIAPKQPKIKQARRRHSIEVHFCMVWNKAGTYKENTLLGVYQQNGKSKRTIPGLHQGHPHFQCYHFQNLLTCWALEVFYATPIRTLLHSPPSTAKHTR